MTAKTKQAEPKQYELRTLRAFDGMNEGDRLFAVEPVPARTHALVSLGYLAWVNEQPAVSDVPADPDVA